MQSQPRNISVNLERSRTDPSMNTARSFKIAGARTSRMTGVSPFSTSLGTRACPRFPDPPVSSTLAQQLAFEHPELIRRMILLGTGPRGGEGMTFTELSADA